MDFFADTEQDPTADFLAREQAILGEDAALFGNPVPVVSSSNMSVTPLDAVPLAPSSTQETTFPAFTKTQSEPIPELSEPVAPAPVQESTAIRCLRLTQ